MAGCKEPYTGKKLFIESSYPFTLSAMLNVKSGYQDKFCFKCDNEKNTIEKDNIVFTQPHECMQALRPSSIYSFIPPV